MSRPRLDPGHVLTPQERVARFRARRRALWDPHSVTLDDLKPVDLESMRLPATQSSTAEPLVEPATKLAPVPFDAADWIG
jgi:hypothetical protein